VVVAVMPDGSGMWVYVNGVGQRLFSVEEDVDITVTGTPAGAGREKA
jgi:hypothetical protein